MVEPETISSLVTMFICFVCIMSLIGYHFRCELFNKGCPSPSPTPDKKSSDTSSPGGGGSGDTSPSGDSPTTDSSSPGSLSPEFFGYLAEMNQTNLTVKVTDIDGSIKYFKLDPTKTVISFVSAPPGIDAYAYYFNFVPTGNSTADGRKTFVIISSCSDSTCTHIGSIDGDVYCLYALNNELRVGRNRKATIVGNDRFVFYVDADGNLKTIDSNSRYLTVTISLIVTNSSQYQTTLFG